MKRVLAGVLLLLGVSFQPAQAQQWLQFATCGLAPRTLTAGSAATVGVDLNGSLCISGTISTTVSFPTIGAAVPATGIYSALNVAGTLRGWSGLSTGSIFPGAVAIVDASGNQVTSFGGAGNAEAPIAPAAATATKSLLLGMQYNSTQGTFTNGQQGSVQGTARGALYVATGADAFNAVVTNAGTFATQATQAGSWNIVNVSGTVSLPTGASTAANQATAIASLATIATNTGAALPAQAGTVVIGGVNVAAINNVTPLMGNGATGTGSQRVSLANDNTIPTGWPTAANQTAWQSATAATVPANAAQMGCRGANAEPTAVTNGQLTAVQCGLGGRVIVSPYSIKESMVRGTTTGTDTAAHTIIAAGSGSNKTYVTGVQCANDSATATRVTLSDDASSVLFLPAGGGNNATFQVPIVTAAATAFTFTASTGVTTVRCNAQGYYGL